MKDNNPLIKVDHLVKQFGNTKALNDVSADTSNKTSQPDVNLQRHNWSYQIESPHVSRMTRSLQTADIQLSILLSVPYPFYIIDYIRQI